MLANDNTLQKAYKTKLSNLKSAHQGDTILKFASFLEKFTQYEQKEQIKLEFSQIDYDKTTKVSLYTNLLMGNNEGINPNIVNNFENLIPGADVLTRLKSVLKKIQDEMPEYEEFLKAKKTNSDLKFFDFILDKSKKEKRIENEKGYKDYQDYVRKNYILVEEGILEAALHLNYVFALHNQQKYGVNQGIISSLMSSEEFQKIIQTNYLTSSHVINAKEAKLEKNSYEKMVDPKRNPISTALEVKNLQQNGINTLIDQGIWHEVGKDLDKLREQVKKLTIEKEILKKEKQEIAEKTSKASEKQIQLLSEEISKLKIKNQELSQVILNLKGTSQLTSYNSEYELAGNSTSNEDGVSISNFKKLENELTDALIAKNFLEIEVEKLRNRINEKNAFISNYATELSEVKQENRLLQEALDNARRSNGSNNVTISVDSKSENNNKELQSKINGLETQLKNAVNSKKTLEESFESTVKALQGKLSEANKQLRAKESKEGNQKGNENVEELNKMLSSSIIIPDYMVGKSLASIFKKMHSEIKNLYTIISAGKKGSEAIISLALKVDNLKTFCNGVVLLLNEYENQPAKFSEFKDKLKELLKPFKSKQKVKVDYGHKLGNWLEDIKKSELSNEDLLKLVDWLQDEKERALKAFKATPNTSTNNHNVSGHRSKIKSTTNSNLENLPKITKIETNPSKPNNIISYSEMVKGNQNPGLQKK